MRKQLSPIQPQVCWPSGERAFLAPRERAGVWGNGARRTLATSERAARSPKIQAEGLQPIINVEKSRQQVAKYRGVVWWLAARGEP